MAQKTFHRSDRVSAQLRRELGTLVHAAVREHGLCSTSVSDVEVTRDLAHAKVFVTALMQERSAEAVKAQIRALCDAENPTAILSEDQLVDLLREKGFDLARRTVAKYREAIGIGSSVQRRRQKKLARVA